MKSQQIIKRSYEMNIIFQKEKQSKFTLLEAMSFHSEVWRRNREALYRHPQFLADQLTLFQSGGRGGADCALHITTAHPLLNSFDLPQSLKCRLF